MVFLPKVITPDHDGPRELNELKKIKMFVKFANLNIDSFLRLPL